MALALRRLCSLRAVRDSSVALAGQPGHHRVAVGDGRVEHFHEFIEEGHRSRAAVAAANALRSRGTRDVSRRSGREAACCAQGSVASAPFPSTALRSRAAAAAARRAAVFFWRAETAFDAVFDTRGLVTIAQLPMMRLSCAGGTNALAWRRVGTLSSGCETLEMGKLGITRHHHSLGPLNSPTYPNTAFRTCNCLEGRERRSLGDCWAPEWPT